MRNTVSKGRSEIAPDRRSRLRTALQCSSAVAVTCVFGLAYRAATDRLFHGDWGDRFHVPGGFALIALFVISLSILGSAFVFVCLSLAQNINASATYTKRSGWYEFFLG